VYRVPEHGGIIAVHKVNNNRQSEIFSFCITCGFNATRFGSTRSHHQANKVKVKFTLEQAMKAQRGSRGILYSSLNLCARWGWVVNATPRPRYPREWPGTHCTGGWVGPRAGLDGCWISRLHRDSIPGPSLS
jgi:hypothetical protein